MLANVITREDKFDTCGSIYLMLMQQLFCWRDLTQSQLRTAGLTLRPPKLFLLFSPSVLSLCPSSWLMWRKVA